MSERLRVDRLVSEPEKPERPFDPRVDLSHEDVHRIKHDIRNSQGCTPIGDLEKLLWLDLSAQELLTDDHRKAVLNGYDEQESSIYNVAHIRLFNMGREKVSKNFHAIAQKRLAGLVKKRFVGLVKKAERIGFWDEFLGFAAMYKVAGGKVQISAEAWDRMRSMLADARLSKEQGEDYKLALLATHASILSADELKISKKGDIELIFHDAPADETELPTPKQRKF